MALIRNRHKSEREGGVRRSEWKRKEGGERIKDKGGVRRERIRVKREERG